MFQSRYDKQVNFILNVLLVFILTLAFYGLISLALPDKFKVKCCEYNTTNGKCVKNEIHYNKKVYRIVNEN